MAGSPDWKPGTRVQDKRSGIAGTITNVGPAASIAVQWDGHGITGTLRRMVEIIEC